MHEMHKHNSLLWLELITHYYYFYDFSVSDLFLSTFQCTVWYNVWKLLQVYQRTFIYIVRPKMWSRNTLIRDFSKGVSKWGFGCSIRVFWASTDCSIKVFQSCEDFQSIFSKNISFQIVTSLYPSILHVFVQTSTWYSVAS